jgi:hypothetical protein
MTPPNSQKKIKKNKKNETLKLKNSYYRINILTQQDRMVLEE